MGIFNKLSFHYELSNCQNIKQDSIENADDLINFIISENQYLLDMNEEGSVVIKKLKTSKKGEQLLYMQQVILPIDESDSYFDELLSNFYTKKPLPYDEIKSPTPVVSLDTSTTPELPEELATLAEKGEQNLNEEPESKEENTNHKPISEDVVLKMQQLFEEQQKEIETLKQQVERNQVTHEIHVEESSINPVSTEKEESLKISEDIMENNESLLKEEVEEPKIPIDFSYSEFDSSGDQVVTDVLGMVKTEFEKTLADFIKKESEKIQEEIKQLDKREEIAPAITKRVNKEKMSMIQAEETILAKEKEDAQIRENERHKAEMAAIDLTYSEKRTERIQEIQTSYDQKVKEMIATEYKKQSDQLERILQGKTDELQLRQKELNAGLKQNFSQTLETFNTNHNQVIQNVEKQRTANSLIDFTTHLKRA